MSTKNEFRTALTAAIEAKIRELKREGVVGMSLANLRQVVRPPHGGPSGTNAQWVYAELFQNCVAASKAATRFTRLAS